MAEATDPQTQKAIWPYALAAILIASAAAALVVSIDPLLGPQPDGRPGTAPRLVGFILGFAFVSGAGAALLTWSGFFLFVFRKRAQIAKSIGVLAAMTTIAFGSATAARFVTLAAHVSARSAAIDVWNDATMERLSLLSGELNRRVRDLGEISLVALQRKEDIEALLQRSRQELSYYRTYRTEVETVFAQAPARLAELRLTDGERQGVLGEFERRAFAPFRRDAGLRLEAALARVAMIEALAANKDGWDMQDGHIGFHDAALLARVHELGANYDRVVAEIDVERRARTTSSGSAPPQRR